MPVNVPATLPAVDILKQENIFVIDQQRAATQDIRPLRIGILNLMPLKILTETDLLRLISNTPLQIELDLIDTATHKSRNTPQEHIEAFYKTFDNIKHLNYDGFIITGAPLEFVDYESVDYWPELCEVFQWARTHVTSTLYICWAAFAGLYYHYGISKHLTDKKISGVFPHRILTPDYPIFRGFDTEFQVPHSRFCFLDPTEVAANDQLTVLSDSPDSGIYMIMARNGREFFITGHSEYSPLTLDQEYRRDILRGLNPDIPVNYYPDNNPDRQPVVRWRAHANLLFSNWLNYFVYQATPYDIRQINR